MTQYDIADIRGLALILKASPHTLKKSWRKLPHFFIGAGNNLKGARFDISEVIEHLKKEVNHVSMERQKKRGLDGEIHVSEHTIQKRRFRDKSRCIDMGGQKTRRIEKSSGTETDPFNLLSGIDKVS